jgi:hypothetical protein
MFDATRAPSEIPEGRKAQWEAIYARLLARGGVPGERLREQATRRLCDEVHGRRVADNQLQMFEQLQQQKSQQQ